MNTEPQQFKKQLEADISRLQPTGYIYDISVKCALSYEYVRKWFRSNIVQDTIHDKAIEHLAALIAEDDAKLEAVRSIATK